MPKWLPKIFFFVTHARKVVNLLRIGTHAKQLPIFFLKTSGVSGLPQCLNLYTWFLFHFGDTFTVCQVLSREYFSFSSSFMMSRFYRSCSANLKCWSLWLDLFFSFFFFFAERCKRARNLCYDHLLDHYLSFIVRQFIKNDDEWAFSLCMCSWCMFEMCICNLSVGMHWCMKFCSLFQKGWCLDPHSINHVGFVK